MKRGKLKVINKKGLSNIIATVLIILLALAAVVIVWQFIRPIFTESGENVNLQQKCLDAEVTPIGCTVSGTPGAYRATVIIKGTKGDISQITAILKFSDGTTAVQLLPPPEALATVDDTFDNLAAQPLRLSAAANVQSDDGAQTQTCQESSVFVACITSGVACTNECSPSGARQCASGTNYQTCGNYDVDSCLEWSTATTCGTANCDSLDTICRDYSNVPQTCSGAGVCTTGTTNCNSFTNLITACSGYTQAQCAADTCSVSATGCVWQIGTGCVPGPV